MTNAMSDEQLAKPIEEMLCTHPCGNAAVCDVCRERFKVATLESRVRELEKALQAVTRERDTLKEKLAIAEAGSIFTKVLDELETAAEEDPDLMDRINEDNDRMLAEGTGNCIP